MQRFQTSYMEKIIHFIYMSVCNIIGIRNIFSLLELMGKKEKSVK